MSKKVIFVLVTCIQNVPNSNLNQETDSPDLAILSW
jgi:hypothetical protein